MSNNYLYNDLQITNAGRWFDDGTGIFTGFPGASVRFKISGASYLTVNTVCTNTTAYTIDFSLELDDDECIQYTIVPDGAGSSYSNMPASTTMEIPTTGEHLVDLKSSAMPPNQYTGAAKVKILSYDTDGTISAFDESGKIKVLAVGDSWMGSWNDWPRFMDEMYVYSVGVGGYTALSMSQKFPYQYSSGLPEADPDLDVAIISFGVNDYNANVLVGSFQTYLGTLVSQVLQSQPDKPVLLIQTPRLLYVYPSGGIRYYDKYGTAMQAIADLYSNVYYLSTESIWESLTWLTDNAHLDPASKKNLAAFVESELLAIFGLNQAPTATINFLNFVQIEPPHFVVNITENGPLRIRSGRKSYHIGFGGNGPVRMKTSAGVLSLV
ncbi:MAG: SGNH/GDSL hydrolase family protein [Desulfuromonadaceae bacterium]|nr:SGNH/GDSL hydrolase family protein [Desulfuromonadaceae bacterium]MDD2854224.1 SGNH/GDSL hydrolase family protein [Desulfuromonadaceae bacterium]